MRPLGNILGFRLVQGSVLDLPPGTRQVVSFYVMDARGEYRGTVAMHIFQRKIAEIKISSTTDYTPAILQWLDIDKLNAAMYKQLEEWDTSITLSSI